MTARYPHRSISKEDVALIGRVIDRFEAQFPDMFDRDVLLLRMIEVHVTQGLQLQAMVNWPRMLDICHDIGGVMGRWDSETLTFRDLFSPRFGKE